MKLSRQLLIAAFCMVALSPQAYAQSGKATVEKLVQIFTSWSGNPADRKILSEAAAYIDYNGMAERSLKSAEWSKLSPQQRTEFAQTLKTLIEERYYTRWHRIFAKGKLAFQSESNSGGDVIVKSNLVIGKKTDALSWRLDNNGSKVVSLAVGDSDLLQKLSSRLEGRMAKVGFQGLLTWMKGKANIGPSDTYEASANESH